MRTMPQSNSVVIRRDLDDDRLTIVIDSGDPLITQALTVINALPFYDPARHECIGMLYMSLARASFREAERLIAAEVATA